MKFLLLLQLFLSVFFLESHYVTCHVSLTFPPARQYSLDFLNTFWTQPPCGMPKGSSKTTLVAGSTVNVTWHLGYAHTGGYRLELLKASGTKLIDLTPAEDNDFYQGRNTAQWHLVTFPSNITCTNCIVRLLRQVPEFSRDFAFWSCADVDIVSRHTQYTETCSGKGRYSERTQLCECCKNCWGHKCQYEDECRSDSDCGYGGKCLNLGGSALPRLQCYCNKDYFGERCDKRNPSSMPTEINPPDLSTYFNVPFGDRIMVYFKRIERSIEDEDDIEFVLEVNGTTWAGVGWRPLELGPICKSWPFIHDALDPNKKPTLIPTTSTIKPVSSINNNSSQSNEPPPPLDEPQYQYIPSEWAAQDPFTPMDCQDIILGAAVGSYSRIRDTYSRGRHTPQPDRFWGGRDDLIGATGFEKNSKTTLIFRRKVKSRDGPDHPLKGDLIFVAARGQQPGEHVPDAKLQLEKGKSQISTFYTLDEYKYHGLGDTQRSFTYMDISSTRGQKPSSSSSSKNA